MSILRILTFQGKIEARLLLLLIFFSLSSAFQPIEPYIVPYLVREKHFTNFQVTNKIFPFSVYSTFIFTLLAAPACNGFSYWSVLLVGNFGNLITFLLLRFGNALLPMQIMQVIYGLGVSSTVVFSSYIFLLVTEDEFQTMTSITQASSLAASVLASELAQLLVTETISYNILLNITLISVGMSCIASFFLPKDQSQKQLTRFLSLNVFSQEQSLWYVMKETWGSKNLQILSIWWAAAYGGFSLVCNYGTSLFEGISSTSENNGHVIAAGTAFGCLAAVSAIYLAKFVTNTGGFLYIFGSGLAGILCIILGNCKSLWIVYTLYVVMLGIKNLLLCLIYAQCGTLITNGQYILLFSFNTVLGLIIEALIQVVIEIIGLDIFSQFVGFGIYFLGITVIFFMLCGLHFWRTGTIVFTPNGDQRPSSEVIACNTSLKAECAQLIQS